jgi:hypothetical protein
MRQAATRIVLTHEVPRHFFSNFCLFFENVATLDPKNEDQEKKNFSGNRKYPF